VLLDLETGVLAFLAVFLNIFSSFVFLSWCIYVPCRTAESPYTRKF
jgi:hypothetical protein